MHSSAAPFSTKMWWWEELSGRWWGIGKMQHFSRAGDGTSGSSYLIAMCGYTNLFRKLLTDFECLEASNSSRATKVPFELVVEEVRCILSDQVRPLTDTSRNVSALLHKTFPEHSTKELQSRQHNTITSNPVQRTAQHLRDNSRTPFLIAHVPCQMLYPEPGTSLGVCTSTKATGSLDNQRFSRPSADVADKVRIEMSPLKQEKAFISSTR